MRFRKSISVLAPDRGAWRRAVPCCIAVAVSWLLAAAAAADLGGYRILRFDVDLQIASNTDLFVEERLQVEFSQPRHGIYRTIPVRYTDPAGFQYSFRFRLQEVTDDAGNPQQVKVSNAGRHVRIRIGSPDRKVRGRVVYVIRYRVRNALRQFPDHDELYWNATGHDWKSPIDGATAIVRLPVALPEDSLQAAAWTGRFGARGDDVRIEATGPGTVMFRSTRRLAALEGLTVALAWPRGHVRFPGSVARLAQFVSDNGILAVPVLVLFVLLGVYWRSGRDPGLPRSVAVQYEPPEGLSPAGIGTLVDERVDMRDITATLVDLAVRGYMRIRSQEKSRLWGLVQSEETFFERTDRNEADLLPHEKRILAGIFDSGDVVSTEDLKEEFYRELPGIRTAVYRRLVERGLCNASPQAVRRRMAGLGVLLGGVTVAAGIGWASMHGAVLPHAAVLPVVAGVATLLLFVVFAPAMPRRTHAGVRARSWALGFEEFVARVEADRFERDAARGIYEKLLPYAMALGVATRWSRRFEGIYDDRAPSWYVGSRPGAGFSTVAFESNLSQAMSQAATSMQTSPRSSSSSGFSGGGFSGGGGGGGGGGSW